MPEETDSSSGSVQYQRSDALVTTKLLKRLAAEVASNGGVGVLESTLARADTNGDGASCCAVVARLVVNHQPR
jgi:hypothetical protein